MKSIKIGLIVILSIITLGLCGILVRGIRSDNRNSSDNYKNSTQMHLVLEKEVSLDGIDRIAALYTMNSNDVYIYEGEGNTLIVREYTNYETVNKELSTINTNKNSIEIKGAKRTSNEMGFFFHFNNNYGYTELWLPKAYKGAITIETASGNIKSDLDIEIDGTFKALASSGDISVSSILAKSVDITTSSGQVKGDVFHGEITIATSSGDVNAVEMVGDSNIATASGDIRVGTITGNTEISSASGDISATKVDGDTNVSSASGNVRLELAELTGNVTVNTISGDAEISLLETASFAFNAHTTSGDINTFFDDSLKFSKKGNSAQGTVGANPQEFTIEIETTSGNIRITKLH